MVQRYLSTGAVIGIRPFMGTQVVLAMRALVYLQRARLLSGAAGATSADGGIDSAWRHLAHGVEPTLGRGPQATINHCGASEDPARGNLRATASLMMQSMSAVARCPAFFAPEETSRDCYVFKQGRVVMPKIFRDGVREYANLEACMCDASTGSREAMEALAGVKTTRRSNLGVRLDGLSDLVGRRPAHVAEANDFRSMESFLRRCRTAVVTTYNAGMAEHDGAA